MCKYGLHASVKAIDALGYAPGLHCECVELSRRILDGKDKLCAETRHALWVVDATRPVLLWDAWCSARALHRAGVTDERCWAAVRATISVAREWPHVKQATRVYAAAARASAAAAVGLYAARAATASAAAGLYAARGAAAAAAAAAAAIAGLYAARAATDAAATAAATASAADSFRAATAAAAERELQNRVLERMLRWQYRRERGESHP
jgi:hypothetical protein